MSCDTPMNGGTPPGRMAFERETGIAMGAWYGRHWARWSDALRGAGFVPNSAPQPLDQQEFLVRLVAFVRELGRIPTSAEIRLRRRTDPSFPSHGSVERWFPTKAPLPARLRAHASADPSLADVAALM